MTVFWELAPESVLETVERIRNAYHKTRLRYARIALLVRPNAPKSSGGKITLGSCSLWPAKLKPLGDYDFLIWFSLDEWLKMPQARRDALADHELCHAVWDYTERKASLRPHDITEFYEVWRRHGPYMPEYDAQREIVQAAFDLPGIDADVTEAVDPAHMNGAASRDVSVTIGPESIPVLKEAARRMRQPAAPIAEQVEAPNA